MSAPPRNTATIVLSGMLAAATLVCFLGIYWGIDRVMLKVRLAFADEQTEIFDEMIELARTGDVAGGVAALEYATGYYPSGTKQVPGSLLDRIVERHRRLATERIIAILREKSGRDLGDDPQAWIDRSQEFRTDDPPPPSAPDSDGPATPDGSESR